MRCHGSKIYVCSRCGQVFNVKLGPTGVKDHILQVHVPSGEVTVCRKEVPISKARKRKAGGENKKSSKKPNIEKDPQEGSSSPKPPPKSLKNLQMNSSQQIM